MSRATATDHVANVRTGIGNLPTTEISDAQILQQINQVYRRICSRYDHPELDQDMDLTTTAGSAIVDFTVATSEILKYGDPLNVTTSMVMQFITRDQYDWFERGQAQQGAPYRYHIHPSTTAGYNAMLLWPVPNGVYSIRFPYNYAPPLLVLSPTATSMVIAPVWEEVVEAHATAKCAAIVGDTNRTATWSQIAMSLEKSVLPSVMRPSEVPYRILPGGP